MAFYFHLNLLTEWTASHIWSLLHLVVCVSRNHTSRHIFFTGINAVFTHINALCLLPLLSGVFVFSQFCILSRSNPAEFCLQPVIGLRRALSGRFTVGRFPQPFRPPSPLHSERARWGEAFHWDTQSQLDVSISDQYWNLILGCTELPLLHLLLYQSAPLDGIT